MDHCNHSLFLNQMVDCHINGNRNWNYWPHKCDTGHCLPLASSGNTWPLHSQSTVSTSLWQHCLVPKPSEMTNTETAYWWVIDRLLWMSGQYFPHTENIFHLIPSVPFFPGFGTHHPSGLSRILYILFSHPIFQLK